MAAREEVTLVVRARDLTRSVFRRMRRRLAQLARVTATLGVGLGAGIVAAAARFSESARELEQASSRLDLSSETLQGLIVLAAREGVDAQRLIDTLTQIQRRRGEALQDDTAEAAQAFERLGISIEELEGLNLEDLFFALADGIEQSRANAGELLADLERIGESGAAELLEVLRQGGGRLAGEINLLADRGALRTADEINRTAARRRELDEQLLVAQNRLATAMEELTPVLIEMIESLARLAEFVSEQELLRTPTPEEIREAPMIGGIVPLNDPTVTGPLQIDPNVTRLLEEIRDRVGQI